MTLSNYKISDHITDWKVLDKDSLSDRRYMKFRLAAETTSSPADRNPRKADWAR